MLQSYLNKKWVKKLIFLVSLVGGLVVIFFATNYLLGWIFSSFYKYNLLSLRDLNENVLSTLVAVISYTVTLILFTRLVKYVVGSKLSAKSLGMSRMPLWSDIFLAPIGFVAYFVMSAILLAIVAMVLPSIDLTKAQEVGFSNLSYGYEFMFAFFTLVVLAPVLEEVLFRGYLIGALKTQFKTWQVVLISALTFGFMHGAVNVGIDTFALGLVLALLRVNTESIWASILLHSMKNSLAFYLLFINPTILNTIGG